jgi:hypothetical protein
MATGYDTYLILAGTCAEVGPYGGVPGGGQVQERG